VSISDLTTSKYSMRISQLTKIQNGSRLEKKTVLKSFFDFQGNIHSKFIPMTASL